MIVRETQLSHMKWEWNTWHKKSEWSLLIHPDAIRLKVDHLESFSNKKILIENIVNQTYLENFSMKYFFWIK